MDHRIEVRQCFTLTAPPDALYAFWRNFSEFPRFMRHVRSVTEIDRSKSHWVVEGPGGARPYEWDAEIEEEVPGRLIQWRTTDASDVRHDGRIEFRPATGNRGTVVDVCIAFEVPAPSRGAALAKLFGGDVESDVREDLRRFKRLVETGEIPTTVGQSSGRADDEIEREESEPVGIGVSGEADS